MPTKTKVLLDTDIDILGDIDDVMCLAYLLAQPACDLLGISTVSWDTTRRAMVASALCKAAGRTVPIFPGAETPLLAPLPTFEAQPDDAERAVLARWDHDETFPRGQASAFMRQSIRDHPGEVVLLAIGPLTNIALLFAVDPAIPRLLKGLVMMAGLFVREIPAAGPREWNAQLDPHATAMVYRASVATHRSVGLDVTFDMRLEAAEVQQRLHGAQTVLREMTNAWFQKTPRIIFHDPLAAATIFDDQICRFQRGQVAIELNHEPLRGATFWTPGGSDAPHEIALEVDRARFFDHYFAIVSPDATQ